MDAVKFLEECRRMINLGKRVPLTDCDVTAEEVVANVEWWSKNNPRKTRQSVYMEQWPNARTDNGILFCPNYLDTNLRCCAPAKECDDCRREFWMEEVE